MSNKNHGDLFADIAAKGISKNDGLVAPQPPVLESKNLELTIGVNEAGQSFVPKAKISTKEELQEELKRVKKDHQIYLKDFAPELESKIVRKDLKEFDWRIGTEYDSQNFRKVLDGQGQWEKVTIPPHYGAPNGLAFTYYRTTFTLTKEDFEKDDLYICFNGVDYIANVFINDNYLGGSHEGFFAPFEYNFTSSARLGENTLLIRVDNDYICMGNITSDDKTAMYSGGDKLYAATGPGYDDPDFGWLHCKPAMGIYQDVFIEARPSTHITDVFVRPMIEESAVEVWVDLQKSTLESEDILLDLSIFGQNFSEVIVESYRYEPFCQLKVGRGDSLTEAKMKAIDMLDKKIPLSAEKGRNTFKIHMTIPNPKLWNCETPWLYQVQVKLLINDDIVDTYKQQFGMRSFTMDETSTPKGKMYLNGKEIKLRGANTMGGHMQQCVIKGDMEQLIDDILLAKIANLNFYRLTQRPVQKEIYEYCDRLGLMTQTDLPPLFGNLKRRQFCEAIRQSEEMERLIRPHACNIMVSYINEPFPNANNMPQTSLVRDELESFFKAASLAIKLNNPDRVIKNVDGDYDPPTEGLPDNHCYPGWYNGHGIDIFKLHKGYWMEVKPGWHYGCGEYGIEGIDSVELMESCYPKEWLEPCDGGEASWSPNSVPGAQTGRFFYMFYQKPDTMQEWVDSSLEHQRYAIKIMTEAFRRDTRMNTFAVHLLIDAFPSSWMKVLMDYHRNPKPAYFAYKEALEPILVSLRTDKYRYYEHDEINLEAWVCSDFEDIENAHLHYQVVMNNEIIASSSSVANVAAAESKFQGMIRFTAPAVVSRAKLKVQLGLWMMIINALIVMN